MYYCQPSGALAEVDDEEDDEDDEELEELLLTPGPLVESVSRPSPRLEFVPGASLLELEELLEELLEEVPEELDEVLPEFDVMVTSVAAMLPLPV